MILDLSLELEEVGFWLLAHIYYPIKKKQTTLLALSRPVLFWKQLFYKLFVF